MNKFKPVYFCLFLLLSACHIQTNSPEQTVTGILTLGHEVRSFNYQEKDYWLIDKTGNLMSKYQQVTKSNIANYQPTVAVLEVKKLPKMTDGFGSDYDGTYQIENIISLTTLEDFMIGNWVEPINHHPTAIQGFSLKKNGKSNSINMASLQYSGWKLNENKLTLFGTSIGNHQTINFIDEYDIDIIDKNEIYLIQENNKRKFYRSASN